MKYAWIAFLIFASCTISTKKRQPASDTAGQEWQHYLKEKQNHWREEALRQLGLDGKSQLSPRERSALYWRTRLLKEEAKLDSPSMKEQYFKNYPHFANDKERLAFLKMDGLYERQVWIDQNIKNKEEDFRPQVKEAIENKDLVPYMSREAVKKSWGMPDNIEGSGNPIYGNERWKYTFYLDTADGEKTEERYLFFERGQLVSWKTVEK